MVSIVFVQPHLVFGGAERQTVLVANKLVAQGHTCHVVLHSKKGGLLGELSPEVKLHFLGHESHFATLMIARNLRRVLGEIEPSFVVVKLWSSILACALVDTKVPKHTYNYCEDLDPLDHAEFIKFGRMKQRLIRSIFRRRRFLTANTNTVADSMMQMYELTERPDIIASTVDVSLVRQLAASNEACISKEEGRVNVMSVGSLIPRKGLMITLEALQKIDRPIDWHIVGLGELQIELAEFADKSGKLKIHLHGGKSNPYGLMKEVDLVIHSAVSEAFGIVLLESMAAGTPVIAADAIGPSEMQGVLGRDDRYLMLYRRGDASALVTAIQTRIDQGFDESFDARSYLSGYSLDNSVDLWVARAEASGSTRG